MSRRDAGSPQICVWSRLGRRRACTRVARRAAAGAGGKRKGASAAPQSPHRVPPGARRASREASSTTRTCAPRLRSTRRASYAVAARSAACMENALRAQCWRRNLRWLECGQEKITALQSEALAQGQSLQATRAHLWAECVQGLHAPYHALSAGGRRSDASAFRRRQMNSANGRGLGDCQAGVRVLSPAQEEVPALGRHAGPWP